MHLYHRLTILTTALLATGLFLGARYAVSTGRASRLRHAAHAHVSAVTAKLAPQLLASHNSSSSSEPFRRKIWQTHAGGAPALTQDQRRNVLTWYGANPRWEYEALGEASGDAFVKRRFLSVNADDPAFVKGGNDDEEEEEELMRAAEVYGALEHAPLKAHLLRYLLLLAEGGAYADADAACLVGIDGDGDGDGDGEPGWIPKGFEGREVAVVFGVGRDDYFGGGNDNEGGEGGKAAVELADWTLLVRRRNHALIKRIATRVVDRLVQTAERTGWRLRQLRMSSSSSSFSSSSSSPTTGAAGAGTTAAATEAKTTTNGTYEVADATGPAALTAAVWEYLSERLGEQFSARNVSGMREPRLVADVLLLPLGSFGFGSSSSGGGGGERSGEEGGKAGPSARPLVQHPVREGGGGGGPRRETLEPVGGENDAGANNARVSNGTTTTVFGNGTSGAGTSSSTRRGVAVRRSRPPS